MNCPYPRCPFQGTQAEVDDHLANIGTDPDHDHTEAKGRTPRTCGHPGFIEDGRCERGHGA